MTHLHVVQDNQTVVDLPEWNGPIPRKGDYLFHPPFQNGGPENIAGCVKVVVWRLHDRTPAGFVITAHPYVEITI